MKISEVAQRTGVPIPTLKFYLRNGLLHAGVALNRTQARYDESHVERTRLIRALIESAGLDLTEVRSMLQILATRPADWVDFLGAVQSASNPPVRSTTDGGRTTAPADEWTGAAARLMADLGWKIDAASPLLDRLDAQLRAADHSGVATLPDTLERYAVAAQLIAHADLATMPDDPVGALRQVVVGTALVDPILASLRRLAQQDVAMTTYEPPRQ